MQLSFRVPPVDVDVAFGALQERGLKVIEEPTNQAWGHRTPNFHDLRASLAFRDVDALDNAHTNEQAAPHTPGDMCGRFLRNLGHDDDFGADGNPVGGEEGSEGCGVSGRDFGEAPLIGWNVA